MSVRFTEEWCIESIGGGISGTREDAEAWREAWLSEYGDKYEINVQRRYVSEWEDANLD